MRLKGIAQAALAAMFFTLAAGASAQAKNSSHLVLPYDATVAGSHLAHGPYQVQWETHSPQAAVTFQQGKNVIAKVEGKVVNRGRKYATNQIVTDQNPDGSATIQELRFAGSSQVIVFNP